MGCKFFHVKNNKNEHTHGDSRQFIDNGYVLPGK